MLAATSGCLGDWRFRGGTVLVMVLGARLIFTASSHNFAAVILTHHLAQAVMARTIDAPVRRDWTADAVRWLPESTRQSVLDPYAALLSHDDLEVTARALLRAADAGDGFARTLDEWAHAQTPLLSADAILPIGLAEYEYGLALRAMDREDWPRSLRDFERAVLIRPGPWPDSFHNQYRASLRHANAEVESRLSREESAPASSWTRVEVGRKDYPGWKVPIGAQGGWRLEGFAIQSPTAVDLGLPSTARIFWVADTGQATTQTVRVWNMVPDGGFELNPAPALCDFGWLQAPSTGPISSVPRRRVPRQPGASMAAVLTPVPEESNGISAHPIPVTPGAYLLWHAWVRASAGANPTMFVTWRDAGRARIDDEIPIQGNIGLTGSETAYAGLLQVPERAHYLSLTLANFRAQGVVFWDDVRLIGVWPPS